MFGGFDGGALGDTWEWDGGAWIQVGTGTPPARWAHGMTYDSARGVVVMFGGFDGTPLATPERRRHKGPFSEPPPLPARA